MRLHVRVRAASPRVWRGHLIMGRADQPLLLPAWGAVAAAGRTNPRGAHTLGRTLSYTHHHTLSYRSTSGCMRARRHCVSTAAQSPAGRAPDSSCSRH